MDDSAITLLIFLASTKSPGSKQTERSQILNKDAWHSWYFPNRTEANQYNHQGASSAAFHCGDDGQCLQGQIDTKVVT
jgi:hypothetical protein